MSHDTVIIERSLAVTSSEHKAGSLLAAEVGLPISTLKRAMQKGAVWLTRAGQTVRLRRNGRALQPGDQLDLYYNEDVLAQQVGDATLVEDVGDYSVWVKPYGMWSHGSRWADHCALTRFASIALARESLIVHRLDRATRGLMLIAHNKKSAAALSALFRERQIDKHYRAVVQSRIVVGERRVIDTPLDDNPARTEVLVIACDDQQQQSTLDVRIHTGRKHQVRRHLALIGAPVVGDRLYGHAGDDDPDLQLVASHLAFHCPVRDQRVWYEHVPNA
ncbi:MAG: RluA family pseudouridine synthase [Pseudomonadota bacterium]